MKRKGKETLGFVINGFSIALFFFLASTLDQRTVPPPIRILAWAVLAFGALLILLSVIALASNRKPKLINRGIYGLIRHPMYLGAMVIFLSWIFFFPKWFIVLISFVNIAIVHWSILHGERQNIVKFGESYERYMETVPRINLLAGLLRHIRMNTLISL
jgi:protein-S-isoprenylcysteine O-methyltransferase Ste14